MSPARPPRTRANLWKAPLFVLSLALFVVAITLMKDGAQALGPFVRDALRVEGFADAVGFGWLFSYVIMSGSPVAGSALALLDAGVVDRFGAYGMIVGSRMGASFIVLFIGFVYVLRGRSRANSLAMGLLSLVVAGVMQLPAMVVGLAMLASGWADGLQLGAGGRIGGILDRLLGPIADLAAAHLPHWAIFATGLALMIASFNLLDRCLPEMSLERRGGGTITRFVFRPWVMFLLGGLVTLVSMSVSISLGILVPLGERGLVRRENVVPYIMGANITTFIDTLLAAALIGNPEAFTVVLTGMLSLAIVSVALLALRFERLQRAVLGAVDWITRETSHLAVFMIGIFLVPLLLLAL